MTLPRLTVFAIRRSCGRCDFVSAKDCRSFARDYAEDFRSSARAIKVNRWRRVGREVFANARAIRCVFILRRDYEESVIISRLVIIGIQKLNSKIME